MGGVEGFVPTVDANAFPSFSFNTTCRIAFLFFFCYSLFHALTIVLIVTLIGGQKLPGSRHCIVRSLEFAPSFLASMS
jgi:hypothetical protein